MKFKFYVIFTVLIIISSCSSEITTSDIVISDEKLTTVDENEDSEKTSPEKEFVASKMDTFKGEWFEIQYPTEFNSIPNGPLRTLENYDHVPMDEATFTSQDKSVEFFVYSPQWGGNPKNYLEAAKNENIDSDKTTIDEIDPNREYRWITFADKDGKYLRSVYSKKSESTHLVFGIKYHNQQTYDKYKSTYKVFKESLIQYAD